jgi:hypothetical protein
VHSTIEIFYPFTFVERLRRLEAGAAAEATDGDHAMKTMILLLLRLLLSLQVRDHAAAAKEEVEASLVSGEPAADPRFPINGAAVAPRAHWDADRVLAVEAVASFLAVAKQASRVARKLRQD